VSFNGDDHNLLSFCSTAESFLNAGTTLNQLKAAATRLTDNQAAQHLNEARRRLFQSIHRRSERAA